MFCGVVTERSSRAYRRVGRRDPAGKLDVGAPLRSRFIDLLVLGKLEAFLDEGSEFANSSPLFAEDFLGVCCADD